MKDLVNFFVGFVFSYILAAKTAEIILSGEQLSSHEAIIRYTRDELLALRRSRGHDYLDVLHSHGILKYRGCCAGRSQRVRLNGYIRKPCLYESADINGIPVITGRRPYIQPAARHQHKSVSNLIEIKPEPENNHRPNNSNPNSEPPSLYLLNPTSIMKPNALQQLLTDVTSHDIEVVVLAETWMKAHHNRKCRSNSRVFRVQAW